MLAVMKAGGAFVPLDPSHPAERLRGQCNSVRARLILCSRHLLQKLAEVSDTLLPVDDATVAESEPVYPEENLDGIPACSTTNAAYIIFTSGSTGKPKVRISICLRQDVRDTDLCF